MMAKQLNHRQAQWSLFLARFDFVLHHKPGHTMRKPDALSRRADHGNGAEENSDIVLSTPKLFAIRALKGLELSGPEVNILHDIHKGIKAPLEEESVAKAVQALRKSSTKTLHAGEWTDSEGVIYFCGKIYVPPTSELRRQIISLCHDTEIAGHPGRFKTLELVTRNYWWPNMSRYIGRYVATCDLCFRTKFVCKLPCGELAPLPTPTERWHTISVDFIVELPDSGGNDAVMVVVDSACKQAHLFETTTTITSAGAA